MSEQPIIPIPPLVIETPPAVVAIPPVITPAPTPAPPVYPPLVPGDLNGVGQVWTSPSFYTSLAPIVGGIVMVLFHKRIDLKGIAEVLPVFASALAALGLAIARSMKHNAVLTAKVAVLQLQAGMVSPAARVAVASPGGISGTLSGISADIASAGARLQALVQ